LKEERGKYAVSVEVIKLMCIQTVIMNGITIYVI